MRLAPLLARRQLAVVAAGCVVTSALALTTTASGAPTSGPPSIFRVAGAAEHTKAGARTPIDVAHARLPAGGRVSLALPLPGRRASVANLRAASPVAGGFAHWTGSLEGEANSTVTVVRKGTAVSALVSAPSGTYTITTTDSGDQSLLRVSPDKHDADLVLTPPARTVQQQDGPAATGDPGRADTVPVVDVLVGYTPGAATQAGGTGSIESLAALSVAVSNDALAASGVNVRFALVGTVQSSGTSTDASDTTLNSLTSTSDGSYDNLHTARNQTGADLVSLLVAGGPYCGIAWYPGSAVYGFSVVAQDCAVNNLSFPHELGHNLGAAHDRYVDSGSYHPGGFGYVNLAGRWRTIMAYNNQCASAGFNCTRVAYFSNPEVSYSGAPTGIPVGQPNAADNRSAINASVSVVAGYRPTSTPSHLLSVTRSGSGTGTVTSSPAGVDCGTTCSASLPSGTSVTLTATPTSGSTFSGWGGSCAGSASTCTVTMTAGREVSASFAAAPSATTPGVPTDVVATATPDSATLTWAPPVEDGGAELTGYEVSRSGAAPVTLDGTARSHTFTGLTPGATYTLSVAATNSLGTGQPAETTVVVPAGDTRHEESSPGVQLNGWYQGAGDTASGGSFRSSKVVGDSATFTFTGTGVTWLTKKGPGQGIASVTIDGVSKGTVDLYSTTVGPFAKSFTGLRSAAHTVRVTVKGKNRASAAAHVMVDGFKVGTTTIEDTSPRIAYNGWSGATSASASGGAYRAASTATSSVSLTFTGTSVDWVTATGPSYGKASVTVDGVARGTVDLYTRTPRWDVVRSFAGLSGGTHTIVVKPLGTKDAASSGKQVVVDAFLTR